MIEFPLVEVVGAVGRAGATVGLCLMLLLLLGLLLLLLVLRRPLSHQAQAVVLLQEAEGG